MEKYENKDLNNEQQLEENKADNKEDNAENLALVNDFTEEELLSLTRSILHKEPEDRTKADIAILSKYFKENSIFEKLRLDPDDKILKEQLFLSMRYEKLSKDEYVFKYGDLGDIFYIIMTGKVSVAIPIFSSEHIGEEVAVKDEKTENENHTESDNNSKVLILINIESTKFVIVAELTKGKSFGELAWLHSKVRMATIQWLESPTEVNNFMSLYIVYHSMKVTTTTE